MTNRTRRTQLIALIASLLLIYVLFFSTEAHTSASTFRSRTESAIARKHSVMSGDISDEDLLAATNAKLQEVLDGSSGSGKGEKKEMVILEGTRTESSSKNNVDEEEDTIPVAGRKSMPNPRQSSSSSSLERPKPKYPLDDTKNAAAEATSGNSARPTKAPTKTTTTTPVDEGEEAARIELQQILKKSPIIIFSKSYCHFSKRAKQLLLEEYTIVPKPYVVELDLMTDMVPAAHEAVADDDDDGQHLVGKQETMGRKLQDLLKSLTGRKTVPNIMISAQSIGGADDVVAMDREGTLEDKIRKLGGKRIVSVDKKGG